MTNRDSFPKRDCQRFLTAGSGECLTLLAVLAQPSGELRPVTHVSKLKTSGSDETEDSVCGHETPLLLSAMNHAVNKVSITDTLCCLVCQFKLLQLQLFVPVVGSERWPSSQIILLEHQIAELVIVEVKLDLVI